MFVTPIDDLRGGPRTQILAWADKTLRSASDALIDRGVDPRSGFEDILRVDEALAGSVAEASMVVFRAVPEDVPEMFRSRCERMRSSAERVLGMPTTHPNETYIRVMTEAFDAGAVRDYGDAYRAFQVGPGPTERRAAMRAMGLAAHWLFVEPALAGGLVEGDEVFDRLWLPLRISRGARWDPEADVVVGGPETLALDDEVAASGHASPVYFPHVWKDAATTGETGWLLRERLYLTNPRDTLRAFMKAILDGDYRRPPGGASNRRFRFLRSPAL